ncbi:MAG: hypothetical protein KatS3mg061_1556 [Dehalococcoidia bacterium]|nr:MAG: hypothetical protein KatS3mg061_1556 [Dehalococcoidia bacterium]
MTPQKPIRSSRVRGDERTSPLADARAACFTPLGNCSPWRHKAAPRHLSGTAAYRGLLTCSPTEAAPAGEEAAL